MGSQPPSADTVPQPSDPVLVAAVAGGDGDALRELYRRHSPLALGLARRILGSTAEAEEVLQEVFLQVWRQAGRYRADRSSVATWMALITRSRAIDRLRSRRVGERTVQDAGRERVSHTSPEGPRDVLDEQRREAVAHALSGLPAEQREVIELAYFAGWTQSRIAEHTGTPLGTVKTRTLLAMRKLRGELSDRLEELL